jgi:hypothetical protein
LERHRGDKRASKQSGCAADGQWPLYKRVELLSALLTVIGFAGLWLCKQVEHHLGLSDRQMMDLSAGRCAVWTGSACFIIGMVVLSPLSLCLQVKAGVPPPGPRVPRWIAWPVVTVMLLGFGVLFLVIAAAAWSGSPQSR